MGNQAALTVNPVLGSRLVNLIQNNVTQQQLPHVRHFQVMNPFIVTATHGGLPILMVRKFHTAFQTQT